MDDYDLIEASFLAQYGIRLKTTELQFDEFLNLTSCLMPDTPLGQIVAIRSETDADVISKYNDAQKKIYNDWKNRDKINNEQRYTESMNKLFAMLKA